MHFVGVDLAWGQRRPTGVAVLDADGRLLHLSAQQSDDEIVAALAPWTRGDCLVAVDAPLVVRNATGNRPAEAALNRDFARFDAGAHPTNTGKPEFSGTPRGTVLAERLGVDVGTDERPVRSRRRAIEVYPHAATVALFRLGRTLKYKNKPGRSLPLLRAELLRLMSLLESLGGERTAMHLAGNEQWRELVATVGAAERKSELRRAEDQVDAVVCAYVALFVERQPDLVTTYGDPATGEIVTPTLPTGLVPSPREQRLPAGRGTPSERERLVRRAVEEYAERLPDLRRDTDAYVRLVTGLLDDAGINYLSVTGRAKAVTSFAAKAERTVDGTPVYPEPLRDITDQIGLRVITYVHSDVAAVADLLADQLDVLDDRDLGQETAGEGRFGYASRHLQVAAEGDDDGALAGRSASVQVRTVLQHAWAEFEHDIRYKGTVPAEHASELDRRFTLAAGLLELADREFSEIRDRLRATRSEPRPDDGAATAGTSVPAEADVDPRIDTQDLATFLSSHYPETGWSRTDHYGWVAGLLLELGITSLDELGGLLGSIDEAAIVARMAYRYPPGAVRRLDDALLAVFGLRYVGLHGNAHRQDLLKARLERLRTH